jgi:ferric-dicitrate binding protein FerR (iron transport regulator)
MTDEILFKYVAGQTNSDETKAVQQWMLESEARKKELARLKNIWIISGLENEIDQQDKQKEIERIWNLIRQMNPGKKEKTRRINLLRFAAGIALLIGISGTVGYFISNSRSNSKPVYTEIFVPKGERSTVILPDGSTVQLNSDSHLKYTAAMSSGKRQINLEGEGFFQVRHDESRPFVVETPSVKIEVLGTSFNVSSYPNDSLTTTYLQSGKVKITDQKGDGIQLSPEEAFVFNRITQESQKIKIQDKRFTDWTQGILTVNGETIGELAKKLERRFNITINFGDQDVKNHVYSGSIKDEDLNTLLEALTFASSIDYQQKGNTITLFSKN